MDMSRFRPEPHVAQQSQRDKLRVQQLEGSGNDHLLFDPVVLSSDIFHISSSSNVLTPLRDARVHQNLQTAQEHRQMLAEEPSFSGLSESNLSKFRASSMVSGDPHGFGNWKSVGYASRFAGRETNQDPRFLGEDVSNNARANNISAATHYLKPSYGNLLYQNATQDAVTTQGLSLSLSSNPASKTCAAVETQFTELDHYGFAGFHSRPGEFKELQDTQTSSLTGKANGKSIQDAGGTSSDYVHRQTIPLGPFTGYATILKNSRFLKPAQELLDELCHFTNPNHFKVSDTSDGISGDINAFVSADGPNAVDMEAGTSKGNNSGSSSCSFYSFNESCRPEYQQKKAKLVYMLEEVCRRYKLYHQQMQMVVSSFDSVAGLGAATPYFSLALKTVAKNFRCLRNAILDQVKHLSRALGEDLLSPTTCTGSSKGDINMSRLKYVGQKSGEVNLGFPEPQQHGWRPQRGLPERAVAILRAWLFEHFLHPYPTDTDKNMLSIQTGLSRNQVSNWFINARVRVWKPMVEEIHMLESKGLAEANLNLNKSDCVRISEVRRNCWLNDEQSDKQVACSDMLVADIAGDAHDVEHWNHEKRSRMDFHTPTNMEGSLMGYAPYEQSRLENSGIGPVSLTLGLRHGVESVQQQQQQYQQQDHLRRQFGGQLIHDFAG